MLPDPGSKWMCFTTGLLAYELSAMRLPKNRTAFPAGASGFVVRFRLDYSGVSAGEWLNERHPSSHPVLHLEIRALRHR